MGTRLERRAFLSAAGATVAALATGCAGAANGLNLTVGDQAGWLRALFEASGALRGAPYEVTWLALSADASVLEALDTDAADVGISATAPALRAAATGSELGVIAAADSAQHGGLALLLHRGSGVRSIRQLRGRAICPTTRFSGGHYLLCKALDEAGMSIDDVVPFYRWPALAQRAFRTFDVDGLLTWDPYAANMELTEDGEILDETRGLDPGPLLLCARDAALQDADLREAIADFRRRYVRAQQWALDPGPGYPRALAQRCEIGRRAAERMAGRARWTDVALDDRLADRLQDIAAEMGRFGLLKTQPRAGDYLRRGL